MNVKRIIRRVTDNDYLFTIFTKILAVLIAWSPRFIPIVSLPAAQGRAGTHFLAAFHCGGDGELWSVSAVSLLQAAG